MRITLTSLVLLAAFAAKAQTKFTANNISTAAPPAGSVILGAGSPAVGTALTMMRSDATLTVTGTLPVSKGGTNSGTALSGTGTIMVSGAGAFTGQIVEGPTGSATQVLHGNAGPGGQVSYSAVSLTADVTGTLAEANGGTGTGAITCDGAAQPKTVTSNGVSYSCGQVALTSTNLSGTLPESLGGTGAGAITCTNQFVTSNGTLYSCVTATLASAQFVNQGTTTTLLHGNAAGNPSWSAVALGADVSGTLPEARGGTNAGAITCTNQFTTSDGTSYSCITATLASAQFANQGTTSQVLRGNAAGNPSWGTVPADANNVQHNSTLSGAGTSGSNLGLNLSNVNNWLGGLSSQGTISVSNMTSGTTAAVIGDASLLTTVVHGGQFTGASGDGAGGASGAGAQMFGGSNSSVAGGTGSYSQGGTSSANAGTGGNGAQNQAAAGGAATSAGQGGLGGRGTWSLGGAGGAGNGANVGGTGGFGALNQGGNAGAAGATGSGGTGGAGESSTGGNGGAPGTATGIAGTGGDGTVGVGGIGGSTTGAGTAGAGGFGGKFTGGASGATVAGTVNTGGSGIRVRGGAADAGGGNGGWGADIAGVAGTVGGAGGAGAQIAGAAGQGGGNNGTGIIASAATGGTGTTAGWVATFTQNNSIKAHQNWNLLSADPSSPSAGDIWQQGTGASTRLKLYQNSVVSSALVSGNSTSLNQSKRSAGCATAAVLDATCTTTVTWTTAFADTNYTAECNGELITSGVPGNGGLSAKAAGSVTFQTIATSAAAAQYTNIACLAWHD